MRAPYFDGEPVTMPVAEMFKIKNGKIGMWKPSASGCLMGWGPAGSKREPQNCDKM